MISIPRLKIGGHSLDGCSPIKIEFVETTLDENQNWDEAVKDCDAIMHVASPFPQKYIENDNDLILSTTEVESKRSTTSGKFISLNEKEKILDTLILESLIDISLKTDELLKKYMYAHML